MKKTNQVVAALLLVLSIIIGFSGLRIMMRIADPSADAWAGTDQLPFDFATAFRHYRWAATGDLVMGVGGAAAALGIFRRRRWGWLVLASILLAAGSVGLGYRLMPGPKYVPMSWSSVLSTFVLSSFCWSAVYRERKRKGGDA